MAFEADCGLSTVLEEFRMPRTARPLATRPSATAPRRLRVPGGGCKRGGGKSEIRNSKFEIQNGWTCGAG